MAPIDKNDLDLRPGALVSVSEAAAILSTHTSTIYRLFASGDLRKIKVLGRVRISKLDLLDIVKNGTANKAAAASIDGEP